MTDRLSRRLLIVGLKLMSNIPFCSQVFPRRISLRDQPFFLSSVPALQLLLPVNRLVNIVERFVINQTVALILPRETFNQLVLVLEDAPVKIIRHPDVQSARFTRNHVHAVIVFLHTSHTLSSRPSQLNGEAGQLASGGTCCPLRPHLHLQPTTGPSTAKIVRFADDLLRSG
jgi:hypothetical protein